MKVFLIIVGIILCVVGVIVYFQKGFRNFIIGTILFFGGIASIGSGIASDSDEYSSYGSNYYNYTDDESSSGDVSFRGRQVIPDYDYGSCNNDCGCTQYAHYPGQTSCVNCAENGCTTNKYGHRH